MHYSLEQLANEIRVAREKKGLSQRELSSKTGVPQSHISRIENGAVDLQASSLIEILRVLDLELMLIPRSMVPAVQGLQQSMRAGQSSNVSASPSAYRWDDEKEDG